MKMCRLNKPGMVPPTYKPRNTANPLHVARQLLIRNCHGIPFPVDPLQFVESLYPPIGDEGPLTENLQRVLHYDKIGRYKVNGHADPNTARYFWVYIPGYEQPMVDMGMGVVVPKESAYYEAVDEWASEAYEFYMSSLSSAINVIDRLAAGLQLDQVLTGWPELAAVVGHQGPTHPRNVKEVEGIVNQWTTKQKMMDLVVRGSMLPAKPVTAWVGSTTEWVKML